MKKLFVNKEACIGCGACVAIDPEHFDFGDEGYSEVISQENIESANVQNAMSSCPTNAINYAEGAEEEKEVQEEEHQCEHCEKKGCCNHDDEELDENLDEELDEEIKNDFNSEAENAA